MNALLLAELVSDMHIQSHMPGHSRRTSIFRVDPKQDIARFAIPKIKVGRVL
jgi:hypothetical protein